MSPASNADEQAAVFVRELIEIKEEYNKRVGIVDSNIKLAGLSKVAAAGIKLAARRHFEEPNKREFRVSKEAYAESLGQLADTPLGQASLRAVR